MPTQSRLFGFRIGDVITSMSGLKFELIAIQRQPEKVYDSLIGLIIDQRDDGRPCQYSELDVTPPADWRERVKDGWRIGVRTPEYHGEECGFDLGDSIIVDCADGIKRRLFLRPDPNNKNARFIIFPDSPSGKIDRVIRASRNLVAACQYPLFIGPPGQAQCLSELSNSLNALDGIAAKPTEEKKEGE